MTLVVDASIALAWHFDDEPSPQAEIAGARSFRDGVVVPQHWFLEVSSGLLKGERRRRTGPNETHAFLARLYDLELEIEALDPEQVTSVLLPLARAHRLSVYDAAYLELALRRSLPLATLDAALAAAARAVGAEVIGAEEGR